MIAILSDILSSGIEEIVNDFVSEQAANLTPWLAGILPDPTQRYPGIYLQPDGNWTVVAFLPDADGTIPTPAPVPPVVGPAVAPFPPPAVDPPLAIESPSLFTIFTDLKQTVSTLTAASIDAFFAAQSGDHRSLQGIGQPVIDAARKYAINASYIVAHAILESGWETSRLGSPPRNNLFGWNAFDSDPDLAKGFASRTQCIDFVMGRVNSLYLDPQGEFYVGRACVGNKKIGMNVNYAMEPDWGTNIAAIAQHMGKVIGAAAPAPVPAPQAPMGRIRGTTARFVVDHTIPGSVLAIPQGVLSLIADDGTVIASILANTGGFYSDLRKQDGPIPPGKYAVSNYRSPRNDEGTAMRYFDVSFSFSLDPIQTNVYGRTGLDIHPDGPPPGTHGCIGLVAQTRQQLEDFRDLLRAHTSGGSHLTVTVEYTTSSGVT